MLGHLHHLAAASGLAARVRVQEVPIFSFVRDLARAGLAPGGSKRNLEYTAPHTRFGDDVAEVDRLILSDAQTSGGLLIAVPADRESELIRELERNDAPARAVIGELVAGKPGSIEITSR
jgi:selenide,water dikinase